MLADKDLARTASGAQPRRQIQGAPTKSAVDWDGLSRVHPDANGQREGWIGACLDQETRLQGDRGA
jgi:hypothetical protein